MRFFLKRSSMLIKIYGFLMWINQRNRYYVLRILLKEEITEYTIWRYSMNENDLGTNERTNRSKNIIAFAHLWKDTEPNGFRRCVFYVLLLFASIEVPCHFHEKVYGIPSKWDSRWNVVAKLWAYVPLIAPSVTRAFILFRIVCVCICAVYWIGFLLLMLMKIWKVMTLKFY